MPWIRRKLRDNVVYVKATADGRPATDAGGRVEVVYKPLRDAKIYRASLRNLEPTGEPGDDEPIELPAGGNGAATPSSPGKAAAGAAVERAADAIIVYTDGACTGNPGPAGIGAVIIDGDQRRELSEYLGTGTNNIAELTAILRALEEIPPKDRARQVLVHSDSSYSIGLLTKNWKAKANAELVAELRRLVAQFPRLHFVKVKGHAGIPENERCDQLARDAITDNL